MNVPRCKNCKTEIDETQRVCHSCGNPHWYDCEWCGAKANTITLIAQHKVECKEKPPEKGLFDY